MKFKISSGGSFILAQGLLDMGATLKAHSYIGLSPGGKFDNSFMKAVIHSFAWLNVVTGHVKVAYSLRGGG